MKKDLTVGELRQFLKNKNTEEEITFGSSKFRMRPLIFYRFKKVEEKKLQIELSEIDPNFHPMAEIDNRKTVGYFLEQLESWDDNISITFGTTLDGIPLEFRNIRNVVAINLEQNENSDLLS